MIWNSPSMRPVQSSSAAAGAGGTVVGMVGGAGLGSIRGLHQELCGETAAGANGNVVSKPTHCSGWASEISPAGACEAGRRCYNLVMNRLRPAHPAGIVIPSPPQAQT